MSRDIINGFGVILIVIGILLIVPFIFIWAVNGLFGLDIQYTWANWFYAVVIISLTKGNYSSK